MSETAPVISTEDRLQAELLQAKMQNIQFQLQLLQSDVQKAIESRNNLVGEMKKLRELFQERYGLDLAKIQINPDGTVQEATPRVG